MASCSLSFRLNAPTASFVSSPKHPSEELPHSLHSSILFSSRAPCNNLSCCVGRGGRFFPSHDSLSSRKKLEATKIHVRGRRKAALSGIRPRTGAAAAMADAPKDMSKKTKAAKLRDLLAAPGIHQGPACHDALSARLVEMAGFDFAFMSGFAVSAARLGLPDTGLISYGEMVEQGRLIANAVSIPVIGDGDNGYGNAMNVKRTVQGYAQAGFAGILIEDQVSPKACGHTAGRKVLSREEAIMKIKAAVDARNEGPYDILIVARTDARQAISFEEALWRARAFAEAGADVLFVDALASKQEMIDFCQVAPSLPKMANMLEGGGRTPILSPDELATIGFKIVAYPLSLIGVSIRAMKDALSALKSGRLPPPSQLPSFEEVKAVVGFPEYYVDEAKYATGGDSSALPLSGSGRSAVEAQEEWRNAAGKSESSVPSSLRGGEPSGAPLGVLTMSEEEMEKAVDKGKLFNGRKKRHQLHGSPKKRTSRGLSKEEKEKLLDMCFNYKEDGHKRDACPEKPKKK
eukprot:TRINITY_DN8485_c0_g1_i1.p1 TRINITY_DN8485_c0_g1~~TRINITY_DN8485_c0_g1_i1.p1  ORF type:complete len:518 (+),score=94.12 TRINITY_DN8485_c0_g1_i1:80-1633(+)